MKRNKRRATCPYFRERADYLGRACIHCGRDGQGQALTFDSREARDAVYLDKCCGGAPCRLRGTAGMNWIDVRETVPAQEGVYLCCYRFGDSKLRFLQVLTWMWDEGGRFQHEGSNEMRVTHWMPICKPEEEN